ncbi:hypothetical protein D3C81_1398130 [compost metagenome]
MHVERYRRQSLGYGEQHIRPFLPIKAACPQDPRGPGDRKIILLVDNRAVIGEAKHGEQSTRHTQFPGPQIRENTVVAEHPTEVMIATAQIATRVADGCPVVVLVIAEQRGKQPGNLPHCQTVQPERLPGNARVDGMDDPRLHLHQQPCQQLHPARHCRTADDPAERKHSDTSRDTVQPRRIDVLCHDNQDIGRWHRLGPRLQVIQRAAISPSAHQPRQHQDVTDTTSAD